MRPCAKREALGPLLKLGAVLVDVDAVGQRDVEIADVDVDVDVSIDVDKWDVDDVKVPSTSS